jgi:alkylation response protein AidB-like acyl-CoA dehydrogenase
MMKVGLTLQQGRWKATARRVAREILAPMAGEIDREGKFVRAGIEAIGTNGMMGLCIPEEYGGQGIELLSTVIATEELAQGCASTAMCYVMHTCAILPIVAAASPEQLEKFIRPVAEGKILYSVSASEPGSGAHLWHVDSYAEKNADGYVVNAFKSWATSAGESDYYLIPVRSSATAPADELTLFLVSASDPQVQPVGKWDGLGMRGNSSTPVKFNNCHIAASQRIGRESIGFPLLIAFNVPVYLLTLSGLYLGLAQRARDVAVEHVKKRIHADTRNPLANLGVVQRYVAELDCDIEATRAYLYEVSRILSYLTSMLMELAKADLLEKIVDRFYQEDALLIIAKAKVMATEMVLRVVNKAFQLCGGAGYRRGHEIERIYRDARAGTLMAPDNDTLREIIGRRACGLPYPWQAASTGAKD